MSFLDGNILQDNGKFVTTVYRKPTLVVFILILRPFYLAHRNLIRITP